MLVYCATPIQVRWSLMHWLGSKNSTRPSQRQVELVRAPLKFAECRARSRNPSFSAAAGRHGCSLRGEATSPSGLRVSRILNVSFFRTLIWVQRAGRWLLVLHSQHHSEIITTINPEFLTGDLDFLQLLGEA